MSLFTRASGGVFGVPMGASTITESVFLGLDRDQQNAALDPVMQEGRLLPALIEAVTALPWIPENVAYQDLWLGLSALHLFESRIDRNLFKPHVRVFLRLLDGYRATAPAPVGEAETVESVWAGLGLEAGDFNDTSRRTQILQAEIVRQGGSNDWERALGFIQAVRRLERRLDRNWARRLHAIPGAIVLGSRQNRRAVETWRDVWNRTSYHASDLFYHDSRLRRALLDQNLDHAYRLMAVLAKAGKKSSDLIAGVMRACYDIDYGDERATLGFFIGASGLLEASPTLAPERFRIGLAKLIWDLSYEPKRPHERIFYDEISLIKSREILIDFRKAMLRSDFTQAWGFAEYAFVHGFEPLDLFDELVRLSPSYYRGGPQLLWAWKHLAAVESLLKLLPEEFGIYVMAHTVRLMARTPKSPDLLDPFPDEQQ